MKFKEYIKKTSNKRRTKPLILEGIFILDSGQEIVASITKWGIKINGDVSVVERYFITEYLKFDWQYKKDFLKQIKIRVKPPKNILEETQEKNES